MFIEELASSIASDPEACALLKQARDLMRADHIPFLNPETPRQIRRHLNNVLAMRPNNNALTIEAYLLLCPIETRMTQIDLLKKAACLGSIDALDTLGIILNDLSSEARSSGNTHKNQYQKQSMACYTLADQYGFDLAPYRIALLITGMPDIFSTFKHNEIESHFKRFVESADTPVESSMRARAKDAFFNKRRIDFNLSPAEYNDSLDMLEIREYRNELILERKNPYTFQNRLNITDPSALSSIKSLVKSIPDPDPSTDGGITCTEQEIIDRLKVDKSKLSAGLRLCKDRLGTHETGTNSEEYAETKKLLEKYCQLPANIISAAQRKEAHFLLVNLLMTPSFRLIEPEFSAAARHLESIDDPELSDQKNTWLGAVYLAHWPNKNQEIAHKHLTRLTDKQMLEAKYILANKYVSSAFKTGEHIQLSANLRHQILHTPSIPGTEDLFEENYQKIVDMGSEWIVFSKNDQSFSNQLVLAAIHLKKNGKLGFQQASATWEKTANLNKTKNTAEKRLFFFLTRSLARKLIQNNLQEKSAEPYLHHMASSENQDEQRNFAFLVLGFRSTHVSEKFKYFTEALDRQSIYAAYQLGCLYAFQEDPHLALHMFQIARENIHCALQECFLGQFSLAQNCLNFGADHERYKFVKTNTKIIEKITRACIRENRQPSAKDQNEIKSFYNAALLDEDVLNVIENQYVLQTNEDSSIFKNMLYMHKNPNAPSLLLKKAQTNKRIKKTSEAINFLEKIISQLKENKNTTNISRDIVQPSSEAREITAYLETYLELIDILCNGEFQYRNRLRAEQYIHELLTHPILSLELTPSIKIRIKYNLLLVNYFGGFGKKANPVFAEELFQEITGPEGDANPEIQHLVISNTRFHFHSDISLWEKRFSDSLNTRETNNYKLLYLFKLIEIGAWDTAESVLVNILNDEEKSNAKNPLLHGGYIHYAAGFFYQKRASDSYLDRSQVEKDTDLEMASTHYNRIDTTINDAHLLTKSILFYSEYDPSYDLSRIYKRIIQLGEIYAIKYFLAKIYRNNTQKSFQDLADFCENQYKALVDYPSQQYQMAITSPDAHASLLAYRKAVANRHEQALQDIEIAFGSDFDPKQIFEVPDHCLRPLLEKAKTNKSPLNKTPSTLSIETSSETRVLIEIFLEQLEQRESIARQSSKAISIIEKFLSTTIIEEPNLKKTGYINLTFHGLESKLGTLKKILQELKVPFKIDFPIKDRKWTLTSVSQALWIALLCNPTFLSKLEKLPSDEKSQSSKDSRVGHPTPTPKSAVSAASPSRAAPNLNEEQMQLWKDTFIGFFSLLPDEEKHIEWKKTTPEKPAHFFITIQAEYFTKNRIIKPAGKNLSDDQNTHTYCCDAELFRDQLLSRLKAYQIDSKNDIALVSTEVKDTSFTVAITPYSVDLSGFRKIHADFHKYIGKSLRGNPKKKPEESSEKVISPISFSDKTAAASTKPSIEEAIHLEKASEAYANETEKNTPTSDQEANTEFTEYFSSLLRERKNLPFLKQPQLQKNGKKLVWKVDPSAAKGFKVSAFITSLCNVCNMFCSQSSANDTDLISYNSTQHLIVKDVKKLRDLFNHHHASIKEKFLETFDSDTQTNASNIIVLSTEVLNPSKIPQGFFAASSSSNAEKNLTNTDFLMNHFRSILSQAKDDNYLAESLEEKSIMLGGFYLIVRLVTYFTEDTEVFNCLSIEDQRALTHLGNQLAHLSVQSVDSSEVKKLLKYMLSALLKAHEEYKKKSAISPFTQGMQGFEAYLQKITNLQTRASNGEPDGEIDNLNQSFEYLNKLYLATFDPEKSSAHLLQKFDTARAIKFCIFTIHEAHNRLKNMHGRSKTADLLKNASFSTLQIKMIENAHEIRNAFRHDTAYGVENDFEVQQQLFNFAESVFIGKQKNYSHTKLLSLIANHRPASKLNVSAQFENSYQIRVVEESLPKFNP